MKSATLLLVILSLGVTGCSTISHRGVEWQLTYRQSTKSGTICLSENGVSEQRLQIVDSHVAWCIAQGLKLKPSDITIYIKQGTVDASGLTTLDYNGQRIGGRVVTFRPVAILVMPTQLGCIRHELLHIHLQQTTGDPDANHTRPEWSIWPTYEET